MKTIAIILMFVDFFALAFCLAKMRQMGFDWWDFSFAVFFFIALILLGYKLVNWKGGKS